MLGRWIKANWKWSNETARVNINILGISKLKWTGMAEFNSDDHYTYYCGQESLRRNGVAIMVNKRVWNAVLGCNLKKWQNDLCSFPRQTIQYPMVATKSLQSCPTLCDPIDSSHQAPPSLGFSRQEYWSGLPFPSPMHESEKWKWSCSVMSNSSRPNGLQPTRLLHPWDFPGKSTGVGCHRLLWYNG